MDVATAWAKMKVIFMSGTEDHCLWKVTTANRLRQRIKQLVHWRTISKRGLGEHGFNVTQQFPVSFRLKRTHTLELHVHSSQTILKDVPETPRYNREQTSYTVSWVIASNVSRVIVSLKQVLIGKLYLPFYGQVCNKIWGWKQISGDQQCPV